MKKQQLLINLGLNETSAKIYLYLLEAKKSSILKISQHTGIARTNVYHNVNDLKKAHLISEIIEGKKKYLIPESPEHLVFSVKIKEELARQAAALLLPDFQKERYEAKIKFYEGKEGVRKLSYETLNCKEKVLRSLGSYQTLNESFPVRVRKSFIQQRMRQKKFVRLLDSQKNRAYYSTDNDLSPISNIRQLREVRFLPETIHLNFFIMTIDDKVLFFAPAREGYSFSFQSPSFAETIKSLFDFLWQISEPLK